VIVRERAAAMSGNSADFSGNIPDNYDNGMGPVIFRGLRGRYGSEGRLQFTVSRA
jgi:hypothetical protein